MDQLGLFNQKDDPRIEGSFSALERSSLKEGAWFDLARGWLGGDARLFEILRTRVAWKSESRIMYDRTVEVPRQYAMLRDGGASIHPILAVMGSALSARYGVHFERVSVALYRDGRDSVAWHGDYVARRLPDALVATVSVGLPRRFLLRPVGGGKSIALSLGWGDLLVMGGSTQRTYQHAIPKVAQAGPRIAIMFRPRWDGADPDAPPTSEQATS